MKKSKLKKQKTKLAEHASNINAILLVLVLALITFTSFIIIDRINKNNAHDHVRAYSIETAQAFCLDISQNLSLVQKMSCSKTIIDWFMDEGDEKKKAAAFDDIMDYVDFLHGAHIYIGINESQNEYAILDSATLDNFVPLDYLHPAKQKDSWYIETVSSENEFILKNDIDKFSNIWRLWIDNKVMENENIVGVFCLGLKIPELYQKIFEKYDSEKFRGYIIDRNGNIQSESTNCGIYTSKNKYHISEENSDPAFNAALGSYLERINGLFGQSSAPEIINLDKGRYEYAAISPISRTDWSIVVFYHDSTFSSISSIILLVIVMLAALFMYVIGRNILMRRLIFSPMGRLTQDVSMSKTADVDFFGSNRDDEIGELARSIRDTTHEQQRQKQLLHAVNSTAVILLAPVDNEDFEASLMDGMEIIGQCVDVDRIHIWRNEIINGVFCFVNHFQWMNETGRHQKPTPVKHPYSDFPEWERKFLLNEFINRPISAFTQQEQDILAPYGIKSILAIPLYMQNYFWGYFSFDDCEQERTFKEDEVEILRSAGLMIVNAMNRNAQEADHRQMMKEIERRDNLLNIVNNMATILLQSDTEKFESDLYFCMGMIAEAITVDRVYIWKNFTKDGELYCTQLYEWSGGAEPVQNTELTIDIPYSKTLPTWEKMLSRGLCINSLVRDMPIEDQNQLLPQDIVSIFIMPVFWRDQFWGFAGFDDCHKERIFSENEQSILRSGGMVIANALLRNEMTLSIHAAADQLEVALKEAQQANNAKTNFLANMSHEMRTPLNAVIGLSELSLGSGTLDWENFSNLEKISNAGMALLYTVNDILDISKIESGKFELIPVEYDIPSLLNDAITQSIMHIGEKPIQFLLEIDESLPTRLYGDDLRVKQILNNLLSNAFKYTREGTVELSVDCVREDTSTVSGDSYSSSVWVTVSVRDTGTGIRKEDLGNLFTDYNKIDSKYNRNIEGTGLGLPITKRIVEMMDGTITVESEYGKGSVFTAMFRQKLAAETVIGMEIVDSLKKLRYSDQKRRRNSRMVRASMPYARVLVVDDMETNLDVAKGMMKPYGMQIDCVTSGQMAIDAIRNEKVKYNAIFMDHMMPNMDGIEAARIIREEIGTEYAKTVPIIALTANAIVGNEEMFLNKGFQAFISKPIEIDRLDAVIREWVRDKELEKTLEKCDVNGQMIPDIRRNEDRRGIFNRRSGINRRMSGEKIIGIDFNKGILRFGGDETAYLQVLRSFASNTRSHLKSIRNVTRDSLADYAITIHGIKGACRSICAEPVGAMAEILEKAAKEGNLNHVTSSNAAFIEAMEELLDDLEERFKDLVSEDPKPKRDRIDPEMLKKLLAACEEFDMDGLDTAMGEIESCEYDTDAGLAAWLRENTGEANFTEIKEKLESLNNASKQ